MNNVKKFLKSVADNRSSIIRNVWIVAAAVTGSVLATSMLSKGDELESAVAEEVDVVE